MPLMQSSSDKAFKKNLKTEMKHGKPQKQALAIAYSTKRANMAKGGKMDRSCPDCMAMGGSCYNHGGMIREGHEGPSEEKSHQNAGMPNPSHAKTRDLLAEGGMVNAMRPLHTSPEELDGDKDLEELHPDHDAAPMELVSVGMSSKKASDMERDLPRKSEDLSLASEIMMDRKRKLMAKGGMAHAMDVGSLDDGIDAPSDSDLTHDEDELDAPKEDGRFSRGLNLEPVHTMEDDEHDESDASLVSQILRDRKNRRRS